MSLCLTLFLAPPHTNELPIFPDSDSIEEVLMRESRKLEFIETRVRLVPAGDGNKEVELGFWMPTRSFHDNWVMVSKPGVITYETISLAYELLQSL